jgi:hypothetical protein
MLQAPSTAASPVVISMTAAEQGIATAHRSAHEIFLREFIKSICGTELAPRLFELLTIAATGATLAN